MMFVVSDHSQQGPIYLPLTWTSSVRRTPVGLPTYHRRASSLTLHTSTGLLDISGRAM